MWRLTGQMAAMARAGPYWRQEPGAFPRSFRRRYPSIGAILIALPRSPIESCITRGAVGTQFRVPAGYQKRRWWLNHNTGTENLNLKNSFLFKWQKWRGNLIFSIIIFIISSLLENKDSNSPWGIIVDMYVLRFES